MKLKTAVILAALAAFLAFGLYLGVVNGVEPGLARCTKYTIICRD